jgi:hypothetical protein
VIKEERRYVVVVYGEQNIGAYASKIGFQMGSFSRRRSFANPIVGVCDVAIAPMILAMIGFLMGPILIRGNFSAFAC